MAFLIRRATYAAVSMPVQLSTLTRSLHRNHARRSDSEHSGPEQNVIEMSADKLDRKAEAFYADHPRSHYQLPVASVEFYCGEHFVTKEPHPHLRISTEKYDSSSGLLNVTPFAKSLFCWFGERGNLGKASKFAKSFDGIISDPMEAAQEINLFPNALEGGAERSNQAMLDYLEWMEDLRTKYVDHLTDNVEKYPILTKKLGFLISRNDRETLREIVSQLTNSPIRFQKDEYGLQKPDTSFLAFKQQLYYRTDRERLSKARVRCELDTEMLGHSAIRKHIPLYDRFGTEVPIGKAKINSGDIISVESNITCQLYDIGGTVGAGIRRNLRSVVWLRSEQGTDATPAESPFKDYSF